MKTLIWYPKCSTCQKANTYLEQLGIQTEKRHIVVQALTKEEVRALYVKSKLPLKRFFNTSGLKYRELELKDRLDTMSEEEQLTLLATDGMLVKRPILETEDAVIVGFKQKEYDAIAKENRK